MKKIVSLLLLLAQLLLVSGAVPVAAAGNQTNIKYISENQVSNLFTLKQLGYSERMMIGPYDSEHLFFGLPANLKLAPGGSISLRFNLSVVGAADGSPANSFGGVLYVFFNGERISSIILNKLGDVAVEIPIPNSALSVEDGETDGRHHIQFFLDADINCNYDIQKTNILISEDSTVAFQYTPTTPSTSLSILPRPFFQPDSILPSTSYIVVPADAEASELQAALAISTTLGSLTFGEMGLNLITVNELTQEIRTSNNLIFVGIASKFASYLSNSSLPMPITPQGISLSESDSGVIQTSISPWSNNNVILYVGGNTDVAVGKAGKAFSTGKILSTTEPDVSTVSAVNQLPDEGSVVNETTSFKDLGYETVTMGLFGQDFVSYRFFATPEQASSSGAYIDLVASNSGLIDYEKTGVTVWLNDESIGSLKFSDTSLSTTRIEILPGILRRGMNRIDVLSSIVPFEVCIGPDLRGEWVAISDSSAVHLPVSQTQLTVGQNVSLQEFPNMFVDDRTLSNLAFVLPENDPTSWDSAVKVAYYIGEQSNPPLVDFRTVFSNVTADVNLNDYNLLLFGQANNLPIVNDLKDALPAPFEPGSNVAVEPTMLVNYSLPDNIDVGYLEYLSSPTNPDRSVLAVLGTSPAGTSMAGKVLTQEDLIAQLNGDFGIIFNDQILSTDTRLGISKEGLIKELPVAVTATPVPAVTSTPQRPTPGVEEQPAWLLPTIIGVTALILILLFFILQRELRKRVSLNDKFEQEGEADTEAKQE